MAISPLLTDCQLTSPGNKITMSLIKSTHDVSLSVVSIKSELEDNPELDMFASTEDKSIGSDVPSSQQATPDTWSMWSQVYADREMRMKLYCRDPEESTPCISNTLVVRNIHLDVSPRTIVDLFSKFGAIARTSFPAVLRHYQSKYSFIRYKEIRDAVQACANYNGYKLKGRLLEVVHYDSAYKYSKMAERSKNCHLRCSTEENVNGYVRQAHLQSENRVSKIRPLNNFNTSGAKPASFKLFSADNQDHCSDSDEANKTLNTWSGPRAMFPPIPMHLLDIQPKHAVYASIETPFNPSVTDSRSSNIQPVLNDRCERELSYSPDDDDAASLSDDEEELVTKRNIKCVDDVGLETEECFIEWLRAKLKFTGPKHFTHPDLAKAWQKLPPSVRRRSDWMMGFLRASDSFRMVGPYICLPEQEYWARDMCAGAMLDYRLPFKEIWEPTHPLEISSDRQLMRYMKALLGHFGPLSVADSKVQLLLRSLPSGMRADPAYSPDGLCRLVEANTSFVVHKDVYYLAKDHEHLLAQPHFEASRFVLGPPPGFSALPGPGSPSAAPSIASSRPWSARAENRVNEKLAALALDDAWTCDRSTLLGGADDDTW